MNAQVQLFSKGAKEYWDGAAVRLSRVPCIGESYRSDHTGKVMRIYNVIHQNCLGVNGTVAQIYLEDK